MRGGDQEPRHLLIFEKLINFKIKTKKKKKEEETLNPSVCLPIEFPQAFMMMRICFIVFENEFKLEQVASNIYSRGD